MNEMKPEEIRDKFKSNGERLAEQHVEWFLRTIRPLLIDHFIHGYKHGKEDALECVERG